MSIQAVAWALEQDLPARPKLVLVAIANHANHIDGYCWLKAETIAAESACTARSVYRFVGALIRNGYLRKAPRKGADGKQRANDYWILFEREARTWDWGGDARDAVEPDVVESDQIDVDGEEVVAPATDAAPEPQVPQDVVVPTDSLSHGETGDACAVQTVEKPAESCGPADNRVTRQRLAEPSESKPKERTAGRASVPRGYRPPPPQPLGAVADKEAKFIFVFEGSRAFEAWCKEMARRSGIRNWRLTSRAFVDGQWRSGWYFPSLFPPDPRPPPAETVAGTLCTNADLDEFAST